MLDDNNARRRNLILISVGIIFYNASGAHFAGENGVTLGFINVKIKHELAVYILAWAVFAWVWWQYSLHAGSFRSLLREDLRQHRKHHSGQRTYDKNHPLFHCLVREAEIVFGRDGSWNEGADAAVKTGNVTVSSPTFQFGEKWQIHTSGEKTNTAFRADIDALGKLRILWCHALFRPGFSEIVIPHLLGAVAVLIGFISTVPSLALLIAPVTLVYLPEVLRIVRLP